MAKQETSESGSLPTTSPKAKLVRTCEKSVEEQLQERLRVPRWLRMERCGRAFVSNSPEIPPHDMVFEFLSEQVKILLGI